MSDRSATQLMGATLLGGLVGASLAMLFAPRTGEETRQQIQDQLDEAKATAKDKIKKIGRKAESEIKDMKDSRVVRQSPVLSAWEEEV